MYILPQFKKKKNKAKKEKEKWSMSQLVQESLGLYFWPHLLDIIQQPLSF